MTDYQRLGEWILGEMLALESSILDGDQPSTIEPIGILNASTATMSTAQVLSVDELVALFNEFPRRPRVTFEPPPLGMTWAFDVKPFAVNSLS
jgi:hypothetical protein